MSDDRRTLGILGGMGPLATAHFYRRIVERTPAGSDQDHHRVVMVSEPHIPDRTSYLMGQGDDPRPALIEAADRLARSGCDLIVMPCNTASLFRDDIERAARIPVLDWVGNAVRGIQEAVDGPTGLLATTGTIDAGVYQKEFAPRQIEFRIPEPDAQLDVMRAIYDVKAASGATPDGIAAVRRAVDALLEGGVTSLVLGCTELPILMTSKLWTGALPILDPGEMAISAILDWFQTGDSSTH